ncbi:MAG: T9SS type A sorting domain-containing protein [Bacteroidales bacterium]|nr:T9SS type A sorting domain-containing protein [Bacteroidales bacterium]
MKRILLLLVIFFTSYISEATVLFTETFDYTDFATATGWVTTGTVTAPNTGRTLLTSPILSFSSGSASYILSGIGKTLSNDYKSETTNYLSGKEFSVTPISESTNPSNLYLSFLYKVKSQGGTQSEIIGLTDAMNNISGVKLWYGKGATTSTYKLGITRSSGASAAIQWYKPTVELDAALTYLIVVKYDFITATASLFVNPIVGSELEPTASAFDDGTVNLVTTTKTSLSHLLLRGNGSNGSYFYMSGIRVSQTWSEAVATMVELPKLETPIVGAASHVGSTSFVANWTPVENATAYDINVYWGNSIYTTKTVLGQTISNLTIADLAPEVSYTYKVVAKGDRTSFSNSDISNASANLKLFIPTTRKSNLKILLKLDDLQSKGGTCATIPVLSFLESKQVKAGFGAIAIKFDAAALNVLKSYIDAKKDDGDQLFEIWNHGLEHVTDEFSGRTYDYQKSNFDHATQLIKSLLNVQMRTFGTPYNKSDAVTNTVVSEDPNYKVFLLGSTSPAASTGIINLTKRVNMESATGDPTFAYFMTNYEAKKGSYKDYMILQGHPNQWTEAEIEEVNQIIQFLASEGCEFVLPYDYYRSLSLASPTNLKIQTQSENRVVLNWSDNTNSEYNYKVERSTDSINWEDIATCPENSTSWTDTSVLSSGLYKYRVCANCGIKSGYSNVVETSIIIAINEAKESDIMSASFYPNPCKDILSVKYKISQPGTVTFDLLDFTGKLQTRQFNKNQSTGEYKFEENLTMLQGGVYLCRLKSANGSTIQKIYVVK